ncbi:4-hydroxyphenyl-beta-ketoacyl-CoA hydrolase [Microbacterium yannicii]|uniref:4-hydroxyphenyl-beta-ketoacyl-CoA hydrolase n=1 Tax=Microbacterium yannicii TaxID=671622 RepID=UPI0003153FB3|nr:4-hydroxyphenyl-beta-ketoacyl-CoA hydrolase [Microbacterium yannicii]
MTRYEPAIDLDAIEAIDVHVHIEVDGHGHASLPPDLVEAASKYFSADGPRPDLDSIATYYRERRMAAVVFTVDAETQLGHAPVSSAEIAEGAARNNDVLIPFGSVDPNKASAVDDARRLIEDHGVRGFKFHPTVQGFDPSDRAHEPLYAVLQDAGVVALFHTGQTGIGAGLPGGRGFLLGLSNPMLLDPVAAHFPELQIIMAHPSVPWQDEALSVATHKHNTWIDLSGWSPKYFPEQLVRAANSYLKRRVLFGSDFPLLTPDRWMTDAARSTGSGTALFKPEVMPGILKDNAARLLGLAASTAHQGDTP